MVAPPPGNHVNALSSRNISGSLNTSNPQLAVQRLTILQDLAEIALTQFFKESPKVIIPTELHPRKFKGKTVDIVTFRSPVPGEQLPADQIFFHDLAEQYFKPALADFDRYIYWQTNVEEDADKGWKVTFQAMRNNGEPFPPDMSLFSGPFTVYAQRREAAQEFAHTLQLEILREQQLFSRERAVERFGEASANVVVRESLRTALREHGNDLDLGGSNLLAQLQRDRRPDGP